MPGGLDVIETYIFQNMHEPKRHQYNYGGTSQHLVVYCSELGLCNSNNALLVVATLRIRTKRSYKLFNQITQRFSHPMCWLNPLSTQIVL